MWHEYRRPCAYRSLVVTSLGLAAGSFLALGAETEGPAWTPEKAKTEDVGGRVVIRYEHDCPAAWGYEPGQRRFFDVVTPKDPGGKHPLLICLHSAGEKDNTEWRSNVLRVAAAGDDFVGLMPNCNFPNEWWWGREVMLKEKERYKDTLTPTETRVLATIEWVVQTLNVDRDRIYLHGISMGGSGSLGLGLARGDTFAALFAGVPGSADHALLRRDLATDRDPPPALVFFSQTDQWSRQMPQLTQAAQEKRYPLVCAWGPWGHVNHYEMMNAAAFEFPWLSIRRNEAYPAFVNTSSNQKFPGYQSLDPDQEGQVNAYFRWTNLKDQPEEFAMEIRLVSQDELKGPAAIPEEVVTDVTLRRVQRLAVPPEGEYRWRAEVAGSRTAGGTARADREGLITIPGVKITARPLRLTILPVRFGTP
ncbi:MAG: hypothetical protein HY321_07490 [Armatimonadetes bacterium]|nr:hypothetical protein [Armatimonadota bacterium]